MRIRIVQMKVEPLQVENNAAKVKAHLFQAAQDQMDWAIFPEFCLSGYFLGDTWNRPDFLEKCEIAQSEIAKTCRSTGISAIFGNVTIDPNKKGEDGRSLRFDAGLVCRKGEFWRQPVTNYPFITKTLLPSYGPFDDPRYFFDTRRLAMALDPPLSTLLAPVEMSKGLNAGVFICEDIWDHKYLTQPLEVLSRKGQLSLALALSASPFDHTKEAQRQAVLRSAVQRMRCPLIYVNCVGSQNIGKTVYGFDGHSRVWSADGEELFAAPAWEEGYFDVHCEGVNPCTIKVLGDSFTEKPKHKKSKNYSDEAAEQTEALRYIAREYLNQLGSERVVIGASGGIDSSVSAALLATVIPRSNIFLLNMSTEFNSARTRNLSRQLAKNLGVPFAEMSIQKSYEATVADIHKLQFVGAGMSLPLLELSQLNKENIQARDRGARVLAAVASALNATLVCNANKTELASGWGTFYGDIIGAFAPLGDVWKMHIYEIGKYLNKVYFKDVGIPEEIFNLTPSAELSANQAVEKGLGDPFSYPYHDRLFAALQEWPEPPALKHLIQWYEDGSIAEKLNVRDVASLFKNRDEFIVDLKRWWNAFYGLAIAKRLQAPPVFTVSPRAFGFDFREVQGHKREI